MDPKGHYKHTLFGRFSTPVVQPMDGPHSHTQISPQALSQVGWCLRLSPLPGLTKQLDDAAAAVVAAAAAVRVYVVASSLGFDVNQRRSDGRTENWFFPSSPFKANRSSLSLSLSSFHASLE